jgi:hypothetical protein
MNNFDYFTSILEAYENYVRHIHALSWEAKLALLTTILAYVTAVIAIENVFLRLVLILLAAWVLIMMVPAPDGSSIVTRAPHRRCADCLFLQNVGWRLPTGSSDAKRREWDI